jgi:hypothetical protein
VLGIAIFRLNFIILAVQAHLAITWIKGQTNPARGHNVDAVVMRIAEANPEALTSAPGVTGATSMAKPAPLQARRDR